jgi:hypothetical protein
MPVDYVVSINQTRGMYETGIVSYIKFYIAKNRNGPKFKEVGAKIDYGTMRMVRSSLEEVKNATKSENIQKETEEDPLGQSG